MAEPNRHFSIGGGFGLLIFTLLPHWYGILLGAVVAFISHEFIDRAFQEYWKRSAVQDFIMGGVCGIPLIVSFIVSGVFIGWWITSLMFICCLLFDIIDGIREFLGMRPLFCCHWGSSCYLPGWFPEETFGTTLMLATGSSFFMVLIIWLTARLY